MMKKKQSKKKNNMLNVIETSLLAANKRDTNTKQWSSKTKNLNKLEIIINASYATSLLCT